MNTPLVSVLMTCYNREKFLPAAIESVLWQTFEDFELIIVDDRSTDGSVEIAREYARRDSRIRVVVNETNLGQFANRNYAITLARGQFIKYHDSDDVMYPYTLAMIVGPLAAEPKAEIAMCHLWNGGPLPMLLTPRMCYQREYFGRGMFSLGPAAALFRTETLKSLGGFPEMGVGSDNIFWMKACAKVHVLLLPNDTFWYRTHSGQEISKTSALREYAIVPGEAWKSLQAADCPLLPEEIEQAKKNLLFQIAKATYRDLRNKRWEIASLRLKHAQLSPWDWLRYLRRPKRNPMAGTPLNEQGEFMIPDYGKIAEVMRNQLSYRDRFYG
jgi:hypothetical protein